MRRFTAFTLLSLLALGAVSACSTDTQISDWWQNQRYEAKE